MTGLRPTHRGYAYQDLLVAIALVDVVLDTAVEVQVDVKEFSGDRFDDLTVTWANGDRVRHQIKHTTAYRELAADVFTTDRLKLELAEIVAVAERDLASHPDSSYRIVLRDTPPTAPALTDVLIPYPPADDPGPPIPGIRNQRMRFDALALRRNEPWRTLLREYDDATLETVTSRLTVDVNMPESSLTVRDPGPAESVLLRRIVGELGVGLPPHRERDPEDVALALIDAAHRARTSDPTVTRAALLRDIDFAVDFGAVQQGHPVDRTVAISRRGHLDTVMETVIAASEHGGTVVLTGAPGIGKTWLCQQLAEHLTPDWTVARHHCWLDNPDGYLTERVNSEVVIGSLIDQVAAAVPGAAAGATPRFAATTDTLTTTLHTARELQPDTPILLIVDGLDHVNRVLGRTQGAAFAPADDPARDMVQELSAVDLPAGTTMVIASQPGAHLPATPAGDTDSRTRAVTVPPLTRTEVANLADRHGLTTAILDTSGPDAAARVDDAVDLVCDRSRGNTLYATYLIRQATQSSPAGSAGRPETDDPLDRLRQVPQSANDLDSYYGYLVRGLTPEERQVVELVAICDFAVSTDELQQMFPTVFLLTPLTAVSPIVTQQPGVGGLKIHHESFSRFITSRHDHEHLRPVRATVADWLERRGFFTDLRAFRHLPELWIALERDDDFAAMLTHDFAARAVAGLQPPTAITHVLNLAAGRAAIRRDWTTLIRCVELRRTADTHAEESIPGTLVDYADVIVELLGADTLAAALVYDGQTTMAPRWGLQLCAAADTDGAAAPWDVYLAAWERNQDNTHYGQDADDDLHLALQRGHLRVEGRTPPDDDRSDVPFEQRVADGVGRAASPILQRLLDVLVDCRGAAVLLAAAPMITDPTRRAHVLLYLADQATDARLGLPASSELARQAWQADPTVAPRLLLQHGIAPTDLAPTVLGTDASPAVHDATSAVLNESSGDRADIVVHWLDVLAVAWQLDREAVTRAQTQLSGDGFYRAWLRFVVATTGLRSDVANDVTAAATASTVVVASLDALAADADPFVGRPRGVDLWSIRDIVGATLEDAVALIVAADLPEAAEHLTAIANRTTTSMSGMASTGPLTAAAMINMLSRTVDISVAPSIRDLLERIRTDFADRRTLYFEMAQVELEMARLNLVFDDRGEAQRCWNTAAHYLTCYGSHKDGTLYEFLRTLRPLARLDATEARNRLGRLQPLAVLAYEHTDGRETNGLPGEWREVAALLDPLGAADLATHQLLATPGLPDFGAETIQRRLIRHQVGTADPVVLAALRVSAGASARDPSTDAELLDRLNALPPHDPARATHALPVLADAITASYDDQPVRHTADRGGPTLTAAVHQAALRCGGTGGTPAEPRQDDDDTSLLAGRPATMEEYVRAMQPPVLPPGPLGAISAARDYATRRYDDHTAVPRWDADALVNAVGWRVTEVAATDGAEAAIDLLRRVLTELPRLGRSDSIVADLAAGLDRHRDRGPEHVRLASAANALAYTSTTGGGFRQFAGADRFDLWSRAVELDRDTAEGILAAEIASTVRNGAYQTHGVTQAVVAAFAASAPASRPDESPPAFQTWDAAHEIVAHRLPGNAALTQTYSATPVGTAQGAVDQALADLAVADVIRPGRSDIRQALVATTVLHATRPTAAQTATARALTAHLDAGTATWLLTVLAARPDDTALTDITASRLETLARSDALAVRVLAADILEADGRPRPTPPATSPDPVMTRAFANAMAYRQ